MCREASLGTAPRGQQPRKPDPLTLSIPFHGNLGLSGNLLPGSGLPAKQSLHTPTGTWPTSRLLRRESPGHPS